MTTRRHQVWTSSNCVSTNPFLVAGDKELTYPEDDPKHSGRIGQLLDPKQPKAEWSAAYELNNRPGTLTGTRWLTALAN